MDCPVCPRRALPSDADTCPQCDTDLRGLRLLAELRSPARPAAPAVVAGPRPLARRSLALAGVALLGAGLAMGRLWPIAAPPPTPVEPVAAVAVAPPGPVAGLQSARDSLRQLQRASAAAPAGPARAGFTYVVRRGDTLRGIAWRLYGRAALAERLRVENGIANPRRLQVGRPLQLFAL